MMISFNVEIMSFNRNIRELTYGVLDSVKVVKVARES